MKKALRFTRISLKNWRNFSNVEVALEPRVFLVGPNASGKSNFLDVFRFLHDIVTIGGGFQAAVSHKRGGVSKIRSLYARREPDVSVHVTLGDDGSPSQWGYDLSFNQEAKNRPEIRSERVIQNGKPVLDRPDWEDQEDPERLTQTHLEQVNVNKKFREVMEFFASVHYLHIVPQLVREPDRSAGLQNDPYGGDFLEQVAQMPVNQRKARLGKICDLLRAAVPQFAEFKLAKDQKGVPHLRGKYEHWRPRGAWQTEEQFSDGTLRLLGLLWAMLDGKGPLLLEEPELSLHPEVVRFLPEMFAVINIQTGRQVLLSTHSKELLAGEGIGLNEVLLFNPGQEGTTIKICSDLNEVQDLLDGGLNLADAVIPLTRPKDISKLKMPVE
ncbi:MAG: AAA family ATPase [Planctomycetes bacterium]|nr:AAA family ATPase [Planctomycetota bacterium]